MRAPHTAEDAPGICIFTGKWSILEGLQMCENDPNFDRNIFTHTRVYSVCFGINRRPMTKKWWRTTVYYYGSLSAMRQCASAPRPSVSAAASRRPESSSRFPEKNPSRNKAQKRTKHVAMRAFCVPIYVQWSRVKTRRVKVSLGGLSVVRVERLSEGVLLSWRVAAVWAFGAASPRQYFDAQEWRVGWDPSANGY